MNNKTCGECKHCTNKKIITTCKHIGIVTGDIPACAKFEPKVITNGDVIRQLSNAELVGFVDCSACIYAGHDCANQNCTEGKLAWLNAPAESEVENASKM